MNAAGYKAYYFYYVILFSKLTDREELQEAPPSIEDADDLPLEEMRDIASGNNKYEFVFGESHTTHCVVPLDGGENNDGTLRTTSKWLRFCF